MTITAKAAIHAVADDSHNGEFDLLLSNGTTDRDGENVRPEQWAQPFPENIPINVNHSTDVQDVVGSGRPWLDADGNLRVSGTFADTEQAQKMRALVAGGHVRSVSVEFLRRKGRDGRTVHELVGGAFVNVPANPEARVLDAKSALFAEAVAKAVNGEDVSALVQAIHDAAGHLGAACVQPMVPDGFDSTGADDGANDDDAVKAAALRLRLKALAV